MYVYAHCLQNHPGGAAVLVINADQSKSEITLPSDAERYTLTANQLQDRSVLLNGMPLQLNRDDDIPEFVGETTRAGRLSFAPASITFLAIPNANDGGCRPSARLSLRSNENVGYKIFLLLCASLCVALDLANLWRPK